MNWQQFAAVTLALTATPCIAPFPKEDPPIVCGLPFPPRVERIRIEPGVLSTGEANRDSVEDFVVACSEVPNQRVDLCAFDGRRMTMIWRVAPFGEDDQKREFKASWLGDKILVTATGGRALQLDARTGELLEAPKIEKAQPIAPRPLKQSPTKQPGTKQPPTQQPLPGSTEFTAKGEDWEVRLETDTAGPFLVSFDLTTKQELWRRDFNPKQQSLGASATRLYVVTPPELHVRNARTGALLGGTQGSESEVQPLPPLRVLAP